MDNKYTNLPFDINIVLYICLFVACHSVVVVMIMIEERSEFKWNMLEIV